MIFLHIITTANDGFQLLHVIIDLPHDTNTRII